MAAKVPETGSAALTYDKSADIGIFDGRVVAPRANPSSATKASPAKEAGPAVATPVARAESADPVPKGYLFPLIAGVLLLAVGAGAVVYSVTTVVVSDRVAAQAQEDLRGQFAERQSLAASGQLDEAFDPAATAPETEAEVAGNFGDDEDVPVILGTPTETAPMADDPSGLPGWMFEADPANGEALGRIVIPTASIDWVVIQGVNPNHLKRGPGHMPGTPMPGQYGNAVISGHRTTYGGPFGNLDRLEPGDQFTVETLTGIHTYEVVSVEVVRPTDTWVVQPREGAWLTLVTCTPKYSSRQRLVVFSKLVNGPNAALATWFYGTDYTPPLPPEGAVPLPTPIVVAATTTTTSAPPTTTTTTTIQPTTTTAVTTTTRVFPTTTVPPTTTTSTTLEP